MKPAAQAVAGPDDPAQSATSATAEERIRDIFVTVQKALKQRRLYDTASKIYQATVDVLGGKFAAYLAEFHELTVTVTADAFMTDKEAHLTGQKREASIPFKLFRDGIRSLRFRDGLTTEEIAKLLTVLETPLDGPGRFDEDMASILWLQNFEHIEVISVDEIGMPGQGDGKGTGGGDQSEMVANLSRGVEEMVESIKKGTLLMSEDEADAKLAESGDHLVSAGKRDIFEMDRLSTSSAMAEEGNDVFEVTPAVLAKLRAEVQADGQGALVRRVLDIICDLFREGQCSLSVEDVRVMISQLFRDNLGREDLVAVNGALDNLVARPGARVDESVSRLLAGLLDDLASDESMHLIFAAAHSGNRKSHEQLLELLMRLPTTALRQCALHLHSLKSGPARDACLQVLRARGREDVPALIACLEKQAEEDLVEVIRAVLASGEAPSVAGKLRELLRHAEERVRLDALRLSSSLDGQSAKPLIEAGLSDASAKVRFAALRLVERSGDRSFLPALRRRFDACRLDDDEERIRLVRAIAGLGGEQAVKSLREIFGSGRPWWLQWFMRARRWRRDAIAGLADVTDEAVMGFLSEGASSWDRAFAGACQTALTKARNRSARRR